MLCEVYLTDAPFGIDRPYTYLCPEGTPLGSIVRVPFGKGNLLRLGVVTGFCPSFSGDGVKPVHAVLGDRNPLSAEMLGLCLFMKEYTLCTFGEAVKTVLPPGGLSPTLNLRMKKTLRLLPNEAEVADMLAATGKGAIRSEGQREILRFLSPLGSADWEVVRALPGVTAAQIRALEERKILSVTESEEIRNPYASYARERDTSEIALSRAQIAAYDTAISLYEADEARAGLLFGITGSGKTKVMMKVIDRVIADKKTVIMLVPEISLTPQTVSIFCRRYGERVAVIHSALSQGERIDAFRRCERGEVDLVIGTRSAIFAPVDNLGMIVIDEEHEHTYKSESDPKYHARDIAAYRCGKNNAFLLLASATPSLESFYKAEKGKYTLIPLRERFGGAKLPTAVIVDMREEIRLGNTTSVSDRLLKELTAAKERDEQAILFLNRRGYNSQIHCRSCGTVIECPRCSVSLTYHIGGGGGKMLCHLCGYTAPVPKVCPSCGDKQLAFIGSGTQKVETELGNFLPNSTLMRMDADTTGTKMAYDRLLDDFRACRADVLIGTQMVAKGHDFPKVTLVGVVLADSSLYVSDFRASERTFSLLTQVIGRAGRASDRGIAVIQTYSPQNEIIRLACSQNYEAFYDGEIAIRKELIYPPFCNLAVLTLTSSDEQKLSETAKRLSETVGERLKKDYDDMPFTVYGPFEDRVYKVNGKYRLKMMIKCRLNAKSRTFFRDLLLDFTKEKDVTLSVDLDPLTV